MDQPQHRRPTRCTALRADGLPCRTSAVRGTDPPRCAPHGGGRAPVGAPRGNQNARTHGLYASTVMPAEIPTSDRVIAELAARYVLLSRHVDRLLAQDHADDRELARLFTLYSTTASRLARLLLQREAHWAISARLRTAVALAPRHRSGDPGGQP